jgi:hypothetical protein
MTKSLTLLMLVALTALLSQNQSQPLDPDESRIDLSSLHCAEYLELVAADDGRADVRTVWAHGYYSALRGHDENSAPVTVQSLVEFVDRLESVCAAAPGKLWIHAVKELV